MLYDFSYKRYLVWPCSQGEGIEHCQFDRPTVTVLRMETSGNVLYSVNGANPTEVSTHK